jgi:CDGSH-type Zn-finger protein
MFFKKTLTNFSLKPKITNTFLINQKYVFCNKEEAEVTSNVEINEKNVIDIGEPKEKDIIRIQNIYDINSKKMGPPVIKNFIDSSKITNPNVTLGIFSFEKMAKDERTKFIPVSPKLGPFEIIEPDLEGKTYHWCSCGMSNKQPFCDMSHRNSKFRPISFKLGEKCDSMFLCGCKLSTKAPFCDGHTCVHLKAKEESEINKKLENINITKS